MNTFSHHSPISSVKVVNDKWAYRTNVEIWRWAAVDRDGVVMGELNPVFVAEGNVIQVPPIPPSYIEFRGEVVLVSSALSVTASYSFVTGIGGFSLEDCQSFRVTDGDDESLPFAISFAVSRRGLKYRRLFR